MPPEPMRVRVYFTHNGGCHGTIPVLYLPDDGNDRLPDHPMGLEWQYFATVDLNDPLLVSDFDAIENAFSLGRHHIGRRLPI